jgi:outer membrane protein
MKPFKSPHTSLFIRSLSAFAITSISATVWAQSNLLTAYQAAQQYDASFASAKASLEASKEKVMQAKSANLPAVNLGASSSANRLNLYTTPSYDTNYYNSGVALSGSYPLWRPAIGTAISQAELSVRLAQASFANAQQDLITRVAQAYFDVLLAQDTLNSIAAQKAAISEQLAQAKREFEVGTKTILDTNEAQARFDQMIAQEAAAQGDELTKRAALTLLTGQDVKTLSTLRSNAVVAPASPADISTWVARAEDASISVQTAQLSADIAKLEIARNKSLNGPSLDLVSSLSLNRSVGSATSSARTTSSNGNIGVQFNYPLYSGGGLDSKVREAAFNYDKATADLDAARRNAAQITRQSYLGLTYGIAQIKALESAERSGRTLLESTKLGYQVGVRINLDVLNAEQALAATKQTLAKARYDALMSGLKLKAATAQLSEADLRSVNAQLQ